MMGFVYPVIGLCCFFIPMCCPPELMKIKLLDEFANESDEEYEMKEAAFRKNLLKARLHYKEIEMKSLQ